MNAIDKGKKKVYKHLNIFEREEIAVLLTSGYSRKEIAEAIGRSPSTIARELQEIHRMFTTSSTGPTELN